MLGVIGKLYNAINSAYDVTLNTVRINGVEGEMVWDERYLLLCKQTA